MVSTDFNRWIQAAYELGVFRYVLPFLLVFLVVYGVLERVNPFGGGKERVHLLLAAVIGLFVTVFTPSGTSIPVFFSNFFGAVAVALVGMLGALVAGGLVFGEDFTASAWGRGLAGLGALIVIAVFLWMGGLKVLFPGEGFEGVGTVYIPVGDLLGIAVVVGTVVFLYWALGEESQ
ncbi:MAG: hypothetical protein ABEJ83_04535 [Candidatus Nanohaloarchaea archaeon]